MNDSFRYDNDPVWHDEKGFMWSDWLYNKYCELNDIENRTSQQNIEIDMIYNASLKGREALKEIEKLLRNKK